MYYHGSAFYQNKPSVAPFNGDLSLIEATDSGITFKDTERTLTPAEYISLFRISRPAFFDSEPTGPNSWSYYFDENKLDLRIDGNRYKPYKIRIDLVKEQVSEVDKFLIVGIEIEADTLSAEVQ